jgi:hypothetical protein
MQNIAGLDIQNITHIRIIDVVGCVQPAYATYDQNNGIVNDPWPTEFGSGGFDLDAVGVIHQQPVSLPENSQQQRFSVYPSAFTERITVQSAFGENADVRVTDLNGRALYFGRLPAHGRLQIDLAYLQPGMYIVTLSGRDFGTLTKRIVRLDP